MPMPRHIRAFQFLLLFYGLLLSLMITESLLFAPHGLGAGALLVGTVFKLLPLLAFAPVLRRRRSFTGVWLAFVLLIYFCLAVLGAFEPGMAGHFAQLRCGLIVALFTSCLLFTRWQREVDESAAAPASPANGENIDSD